MDRLDGGGVATPSGPSPDDAGFKEWALVRRGPLRRSAYLLCGDWYHADDLVQDVLIRMYDRWHRVAATGTVDAYARRVLVTTFLNARRRPWRRETSYAAPPDTDPDLSVDRSLDGAEGPTTDAIQALAGLPPRERAVLVLRFIDDLSVAETAAVMACSQGTVKSQTSRALARLRTTLDLDTLRAETQS